MDYHYGILLLLVFSFFFVSSSTFKLLISPSYILIFYSSILLFFYSSYRNPATTQSFELVLASNAPLVSSVWGLNESLCWIGCPFPYLLSLEIFSYNWRDMPNRIPSVVDTEWKLILSQLVDHCSRSSLFGWWYILSISLLYSIHYRSLLINFFSLLFPISISISYLAFYYHFIPFKSYKQRYLNLLQQSTPSSLSTTQQIRRVLSIGLTLLIAYLSIQPVSNLLQINGRQVMNTGFDPLKLVNTYGAFGTVGKERYEVILEGTNETQISPHTGILSSPFRSYFSFHLGMYY